MMGHKEKLKGGDEWDAFTSWRRMFNWKPGVLRQIKRAFSKRVRKNARKAAETE